MIDITAQRIERAGTELKKQTTSEFRKRLQVNQYVFWMAADMAKGSLRGMVAMCLWVNYLDGIRKLSVGEIVEGTGLSNSEASICLKELAKKRVITQSKEGKFVYNSLSERATNFLSMLAESRVSVAE